MRWRIATLTTIGVAMALSLTGLAYGYYSQRSSTPGAAAVGSLNVGTNPGAPTSCNYSALVPGVLSGSPSCSLTMVYTGAAPAIVALSVTIESSSGVGGSALYDGSNVTGLTFALTDGTNSYYVPTGPGTTGGSCPNGETCWSAPNDLAAWYLNSTAELVFRSGDQVTWTLTPSFPSSVGNAYQGAAATVLISAHAVTLTTLPTGCTLATIGQNCPASGSFSWG